MQTCAQVFTHAHAERTCHSEMSQKSLREDVTRDVSDVMHWKCGLRKSQLVGVLGPRKTVDFRGPLKPGQWPCGRCRMWFGAVGKVSIERWYLSPYVGKPFNSKVIKSFVPEQRSCVFVFPDSYVIYMCVMDIMNVLRTGMNMSISRIHI